MLNSFERSSRGDLRLVVVLFNARCFHTHAKFVGAQGSSCFFSSLGAQGTPYSFNIATSLHISSMTVTLLLARSNTYDMTCGLPFSSPPAELLPYASPPLARRVHRHPFEIHLIFCTLPLRHTCPRLPLSNLSFLSCLLCFLCNAVKAGDPTNRAADGGPSEQAAGRSTNRRRPKQTSSRRPVQKGSRRPKQTGSRWPVQKGSRRPKQTGRQRLNQTGSRRPDQSGSWRPKRTGNVSLPLLDAWRPKLEIGPLRTWISGYDDNTYKK